MADEQETLAQTQARLAKVGQDIPQTTPYGPASVEQDARLDQLAAVPAEPAVQRPDPYASGSRQRGAAPSGGVSHAPPIFLLILGVVVFACIGAVVGYFAFTSDTPQGNDPTTEYSEQWQSFPGVSYVDPTVTLEQPSYEQVVAATEAMASQYRDALTTEFGVVWTQNYEPYSGLEDNGYGSDSMLHYYDTGAWQASMKLDDAEARERILELFTEITATDGEGVVLVNELYSDDDALSESQFGAAGSGDQALWSFFDSFPALANLYLSSDVYDSAVPVDPSFTGASNLILEESGDTLYVTVSGYVGALLKEADRAAFIAALEPFGGDFTP